jgi:hypothetical protein
MTKFYALLIGTSLLAAIVTSLWTVNAADASGANRFAVYQSDGGDIFLRRSTDNGNTWKNPVNLSTNPGKSYNPELGIVGSNVYVIWTQANAAATTNDMFFRKSSDNGGSWGPKVKISTSGNVFDAHFAASGSNVYVIWQEGEDNAPMVKLRRSTDYGATWKPITTLIDQTGNEDNAPGVHGIEIAASGTNVYRTAIHTTKMEGAQFDVARSADSGATWKSGFGRFGDTNLDTPEIAISTSNVYVVWHEKSDIYLRRSTDNGNTWKSIVNISSNPGNSYNPTVRVSGANIYVSWVQDGTGGTDVYFRKSTNNGASWGAKVKISDTGSIWHTEPVVITAIGSNVYISWVDVGRTPDVMDIHFRASKNNGGTWGSILDIIVSDSQSNNISMAATGNSVFVLWREDGDQLLIKRSTNNGDTWLQKVIGPGCSPLICDGQTSQVGL